MKKVLFGFCVTLMALSANASYLYWQVSGNESWSNGGTLSSALSGYTIESIKLYSGTIGSGTELISKLSATDAAVTPTAFWSGNNEVYVDLGAGITTSSTDKYSFYVEIRGYDTTPEQSSIIAQSQITGGTYADLATAGSLHAELSKMTATVTAMVGSSYAAPEPTSGLLLLVGGALLALRRRRA